MNLVDIYAEIETVLATIDGVNVQTVGSQSVSPPALELSVPTSITYDPTYGGAAAGGVIELNLIVIVSKTSATDTTQILLELVSTEGERSIKAVLETATYTTLDDLTVTMADEFGAISVGGNNYLSANFTIQIHA